MCPRASDRMAAGVHMITLTRKLCRTLVALAVWALGDECHAGGLAAADVDLQRLPARHHLQSAAVCAEHGIRLTERHGWILHSCKVRLRPPLAAADRRQTLNPKMMAVRASCPVPVSATAARSAAQGLNIGGGLSPGTLVAGTCRLSRSSTGCRYCRYMSARTPFS